MPLIIKIIFENGQLKNEIHQNSREHNYMYQFKH